MFAWSTEPGGGPAVLPSVCCAFGTAVVQPAGLRCRNVAGAPVLGCEFYPMYQFKSLRPSRQAGLLQTLGIIHSLKCLLPCSCRVMLFTSWLRNGLRYAGSQLWRCSTAVCGQWAHRAAVMWGSHVLGGGRRRRAGGKVLPSAGEHSAASTAVLTANSHRGLHVAGREQCAGVCMPFRTQ